MLVAKMWQFILSKSYFEKKMWQKYLIWGEKIVNLQRL